MDPGSIRVSRRSRRRQPSNCTRISTYQNTCGQDKESPEAPQSSLLVFFPFIFHFISTAGDCANFLPLLSFLNFGYLGSHVPWPRSKSNRDTARRRNGYIAILYLTVPERNPSPITRSSFSRLHDALEPRTHLRARWSSLLPCSVPPSNDYGRSDQEQCRRYKAGSFVPQTQGPGYVRTCQRAKSGSPGVLIHAWTENAKDTLCRNVTIYGKCRYEDKGRRMHNKLWVRHNRLTRYTRLCLQSHSREAGLRWRTE